MGNRSIPGDVVPSDRRARKVEHCPQFSTSERQEAARFRSMSGDTSIADARTRPIRETTRSTGFCVKGSSGHVREISHHIRRVSPAAPVLQAAVLAAALDLCRKGERDFPAGQPSRHRSAPERDDRAGPPPEHVFSDRGALLTRSMRGAFAARSSAGYRPSGGACHWAIAADCSGYPASSSIAPLPCPSDLAARSRRLTARGQTIA